MNLINRALFDTINQNICDNKVSSLPKWARDEKLYNCEPPTNKKPTRTKIGSIKNIIRLFCQSIVNIR